MDLDEIAQKISGLFDAVVQRLSQFFDGMTQDDRVVFYVLLAAAVVLGYFLGRNVVSRISRARGFQNRGEALVSHVALMNFSSPDYHLMNHVTLPMEDGTTQVDHILVSRFGVFVIETKHYKGWIFANAQQKTWTQVVYRFKSKFQNPIHQNMLHVRAVQELLDFLPSGNVKSVVVFTGDAEFKTEVPSGVFGVSEMVDFLRNQTEELISLNRVQFCVGRLETARLAISGQTDVEHIESLERRHGGGI